MAHFDRVVALGRSSESRACEAPAPIVLTVDQVADLLQVSRWFVYDHGDELGLVKIGGSNRYLPERVERYLAERQSRRPAAPTSPAVRTERRAQRTPRKRTRRVPLLERGAGLNRN